VHPLRAWYNPNPRMSPHRRASAGEATAAPFVARKAKALDLALGKAIRRVTSDSDEEALHDMRVAMRRLRTLLRLARPLYGRFRTDAVRGAFSLVQSRTGDLRDEEALEEMFQTLVLDDPAFVAWRLRRRAREKKLRATVVASLRAGDLARARKLLSALLLFPPKPSRDHELARFARRAVIRARKNVDKKRDAPTSDVEAMHALRILYKELRYATEIFAEVLPLDLAALIAPAAKLQKRLGDIHDIDTALDVLSRARRLPPETRARVAGALVELRARKTKKYLEDTAPTVKAPSEPPLALALASRASRVSPLEAERADAREPETEEPQAAGGASLRKISTF
jgi:CHAD domain-containing protein